MYDSDLMIWLFVLALLFNEASLSKVEDCTDSHVQLLQDLVQNATKAATCKKLWVSELQSKHTLQACATLVCGSRQAALHAELWQTVIKYLSSFLLYKKQDNSAATCAPAT